jgi:hypothetical protein
MKISNTTRKAIVVLLFLGLFLVFLGGQFLTSHSQQCHHFTIHLKSGKVILPGSYAQNDDDILKTWCSGFVQDVTLTCVNAISDGPSDYELRGAIRQIFDPNININAP